MSRFKFPKNAAHYYYTPMDKNDVTWGDVGNTTDRTTTDRSKIKTVRVFVSYQVPHAASIELQSTHTYNKGMYKIHDQSLGVVITDGYF